MTFHWPRRVRRVIYGPCKIAGSISRIVELENGLIRIETWDSDSKASEPGGAHAHEFFNMVPVSAALAARMEIPPAELRTR